MVRHIALLLTTAALAVLASNPVEAAPQQSVEQIEEQLEQIEQARMPEDRKQNIREHLMKKLEEARAKQGGGD